MKRLIEIAVLQIDTQIEMKLRLDGRTVFSDNFNYLDAEHAEGHMADLFNLLTGDRYSKPRRFPKLETNKPINERH